MIRVYMASKLKYAERFRKYRDEWLPHIHLHARWFDQAHIEQTTQPTPEDFHIFWLVDEEDVRDSDALILYGEPDDKLHGALVEAGMALAFKKMVLLVGDCPSFGTWRHHPLVVEAGTFENAKTMLLRRFR